MKGLIVKVCAFIIAVNFIGSIFFAAPKIVEATHGHYMNAETGCFNDGQAYVRVFYATNVTVSPRIRIWRPSISSWITQWPGNSNWGYYTFSINDGEQVSVRLTDSNLINLLPEQTVTAPACDPLHAESPTYRPPMYTTVGAYTTMPFTNDGIYLMPRCINNQSNMGLDFGYISSANGYRTYSINGGAEVLGSTLIARSHDNLSYTANGAGTNFPYGSNVVVRLYHGLYPTGTLRATGTLTMPPKNYCMIPPPPPTLLAPTDGSGGAWVGWFNTPQTFSAQITTANGQPGRAEFDFQTASVPDQAGTTVSSGSNSTWDSSSLGHGSYQWRARIIDSNGEASLYSPYWQYKLDTIPPAPRCTNVNSNNGTLNFSWYIEEEVSPYSGINYFAVQQSRAGANDWSSMFTQIGGNSRTQSGSYSFTAVNPGQTYDVRILAYDVVGNSSGYVSCGQVAIPHVPYISLVSPLNGLNTVNNWVNTNPTFTARMIHGGGGSLYANYNFFQISGNPAPPLSNVNGTTVAAGQNSLYTFSPGLSDGKYTWRGRAVSTTFSQTSTYSPNWRVKIDTRPPNPSCALPTADPTGISTNVSAQDDTSATTQVSGIMTLALQARVVSGGSWQTIMSSTLNSSPGYSEENAPTYNYGTYKWTGATLGETYEIRAQATDRAGSTRYVTCGTVVMPPPGYSISGQVYNDFDNDSVKNGPDTPFTESAVTVYAMTTASPPVIVGMANTDPATGNYTIPPLANGTYIMDINPLPDYAVTERPTVTINSANVVNANIGLHQGTCHDGVDNNDNDTVDCGNPTAVPPVPGESFCFSDNNPKNNGTGGRPNTCCPPGSPLCPGEITPIPECLDSIDNDSDGEIDGGDPDCHTDGDPDNPDSFVPDRNENPPPVCTPGVQVGDPLSDTLTLSPGTTADIQVEICEDVEDPIYEDPPPPTTPTYNWDPRSPVGDDPLCAGGNIVIDSSTPEGSYGTYTAPACPTSEIVCRPNVSIRGNNGEISSQNDASITIRRASTITAHVRVISDSNCGPSEGVPLEGVSLALLPPSTRPPQETNGSGETSFACVADGVNYTLSLGGATGYTIVATRLGSVVNSNPSGNSISLAPLSGDTTATFCIAPNTPWFQMDTGSVRMNFLTNPVPADQTAATSLNYPGIFYSSNVPAQIEYDRVSEKGWMVDREYNYSADTENKNGSLSYDFYQAKVKQDGVTTVILDSEVLTNDSIPTTGVYQRNGNLIISEEISIEGKRVVILVSGNVTISERVLIEPNNGIFILAAKGNIIVNPQVGVDDPSTEYVLGDSDTHTLDGYYSAQGSINLAGGLCSGFTPDKRVNIGGALVANSHKPFVRSGLNKINMQRSLCGQNLEYPSLSIAQRPDFLIQLTDFYKTMNTRWQEVNP